MCEGARNFKAVKGTDGIFYLDCSHLTRWSG